MARSTPLPVIRDADVPAEAPRALVVDLDGTLVRSDLLVETAFAAVARRPASLPGLVASLAGGKAALKETIAASGDFDASRLPYDEVVLDYVRQARAAGRPIYLASASNQRLVAAVAEHVGLFTGWFASDAGTNLSASAKAQRLVEVFGRGGFDYVGNDRADLPVWAEAHTAIAIRTSGAVRRSLGKLGRPVENLASTSPTWRDWIKLLRVHQYAKNLLVLVPLLTSHSFSLAPLTAALMALVAFSLSASSIYLFNDLADLDADRGHPTKQNRPLANGTIPVLQAAIVASLLLLSGLLVGAAVSLELAAVVAAYWTISTSYSFVLKRKLMLDVVTLACLYAVRVVGGVVAISVVISPWLLAFSLFIFTALALMKRYIELAVRLDGSLQDPANRDYRIGDLSVVMSIAAAAGLNAVTILALYVSSPGLAETYRHQERLWLLCPLMLYWIGRALVLAHRRMIHDDPIVFALTDKVSRYTVLAMLAVVVAAI